MMKLALVIVALTIFSAPALAQTQPDGRTIVVEFGDLDLSHSQNVAVLADRIDGKARSLCRSMHSSKSTEAIKNRKACWQQAMRQAADNVGNTAFASLVDRAIDPASPGRGARQYANR
jgi:UrcA family protein